VVGVVFSEDGKRFVGGMCRAARSAEFSQFLQFLVRIADSLSETNV